MQPKIYNMNINLKNATMGSLLKIFSTDTDHAYKDIIQNIHFDVVLSVFIHSCTKKRRRAQFSIRAELTWLSVSGRARMSSLFLHYSSSFQDKNVVDYKILDYFSA